MVRAIRVSVTEMSDNYRVWLRERMYGEVEEEVNR